METERLIFKKLAPNDTVSLFKVFGDYEVMKYWVGGPDKDSSFTKQRIVDTEIHWKDHGFGDWGILSKTDLKIIGFGGLHYISNMEEVNIGYAFKRSFWVIGLAFEACKAILRFGLQTLIFPKIVAVIWPDNLASINLMKKCGLNFWKKTIWSGSDRVVYSIDNT